MSLWRRGNIWWCGFIIDGVRVQESTGASNRKQAELVYHKRRLEANARRQEVIRVDPNMTLAGLAAQFISDGAARPHHIERLKFLLPYFGEMAVVRLNRGLADEYRRARKSSKPISDATVNRDLSTMRHILYWALDHGLLSSNPMARIRLVPEARKYRKVLGVVEENLILAVAPEHLREMITFGLDTGMRRGELTNQLWEDVDLSRRLLSVTKSKTVQGEKREIPLTKRAFDLLARRRQAEGLVFVYRGKPVRILKTAWKGTLRRAGLKHFRFHDLRHSFATRLMECGVPQDVRMALMGHSSGQRVHSAYVHVELPIKRRAIAQLEAWFSEQQQFTLKEDNQR